MAESKFPVTVVIGAVDNISYKIMEINQKLEKVTKPLQRMKTAFGDLARESGLSKLGSAIGDVGSKGRQFFSDLGGAALKVAGIMATVGFAFSKLVKGAADSGDAIKDASNRLGVSTKFFQEFQYAASQTGVDMEKVEIGLTKLSKGLGDAQAGTGEALTVFKGLGIALKDSSGKARGMEQIIPELADKLQKIKDPALRNAAAMRLFGRDGAKLAVTLSQGKSGLKKFADEANRLGLVLSDEQIDKAAEFNDKWDSLVLSITKTRDAFGAELFPVLIELFEKLQQFITENRPQIIEFARTFAKELPGILMQIKDLFVALYNAVQPLIGLFQTLSRWFGATNVVMGIMATIVGGKLLMSFLSFAGAIWRLGGAVLPVLIRAMGILLPLIYQIGVALLTTPLGWFIAGAMAIAGAAYLIYKNWEPIKEFFSGIWDGMIESWGTAKAFFDEILATIGRVGNALTGGMIGRIFEQFVGGSAASGPPVDTQKNVSAANSAGRSENQITVNFENMPKGTRVVQDKAEAPIDISMGYSMAGAM